MKLNIHFPALALFSPPHPKSLLIDLIAAIRIPAVFQGLSNVCIQDVIKVLFLRQELMKAVIITVWDVNYS